MIIVTTKDIPGYRITDVKGLAFGSVTRALAIGGNATGGRGKDQSQVVAELRQQAVERLVAYASAIGANAVIRARFETSHIGEFTSEVVVYGTAVVIQREE